MGLERQSKAIDALRLSESQRANILAEMDRNSQKSKTEGLNKRVHTRYTYQPNAGLMVQIVHPGGSGGDYLVKPRNISTGGIGFLHGGYVHSNTSCIIHLRTLDGEVAAVNGVVMNCRHISGRVHEVGVKFASPVDLSDFVENFVKSDSDTQVSVALPKLMGRAI